MRSMTSLVWMLMCALVLSFGCNKADDATDDTTTTDTTDTNTDATGDDTASTRRTESYLSRPTVPDGGCFIDYNLDRNGDGRKDTDAQIVYDADGNWAEYRFLDGEDVTFRNLYTRDAQGNLTKLEQYDSEGAIVYTRTTEYDEAGNATRSEEDTDADGSADNVWTATHNSEGYRLTYKRDDQGDGKWDVAIAWTYGDDGRMSGYEIDDNNDGFVNTVASAAYADTTDGYTGVFSSYEQLRDTAETYTWNEAGRLVTYQMDYDNDGTADYSTTTQFDAETGLPTIREIDNDNDGTVDTVVRFVTADANGYTTETHTETTSGAVVGRTVYTVDANGNVLTMTRYDAAGDKTYYRENTFNDNDRLVMQLTDSDADGEWEGTLVVDYDEAGQATTTSYNSAANQDNPDTPELVITGTAWDENGYRTAGTIDRSNNGQIDANFESTYDADGNMLTDVTTGSGDEAADYIENNVYDADGQLLSQTQDFYGDSTSDSVETYTYNDAGEVLTYVLDSNGDGEMEETWKQMFDADGHLESYLSDSNGNGSWNFLLIAQTACIE